MLHVGINSRKRQSDQVYNIKSNAYIKESVPTMRYTCIMYNEYYGKQLSHTFADTLDNVWEFTLALENLFPQQKVQQQDNTW